MPSYDFSPPAVGNLQGGVQDFTDYLTSQGDPRVVIPQHQRSLVLQALEQAYHGAMQQSSQSAEAAARAAGTWADTPEFRAGLESEAGNQARGTQAALLGRISALRNSEGLKAFDPNEVVPQGPGQLPGPSQFYNAIDPTIDSNTRAQILREFEAAYGNLGQDVANSFYAQSGINYNDPDAMRSLQSDVYAGTTGANAALQARMNALRSSLGMENFTDPSTSGQRYRAAAGQVHTAANPQIRVASASGESETPGADSEGSSTDEAGEQVAPSTTETDAEAATRTNAVTAAKTVKPKPTGGV